MEKDTKTWIIALLFIFIFLLVGAFLIKPAVTGYAVYTEMSKSNTSIGDYEEGLNNMKENLATLNTNLSSCNYLNEKVLDNIINISGRYSICMEELHTCNTGLKREKEELIEKYDEIIENVANKICCKEKVDNPHIEYYTIDNKEIECLEEKEDESKRINCNF